MSIFLIDGQKKANEEDITWTLHLWIRNPANCKSRMDVTLPIPNAYENIDGIEDYCKTKMSILYDEWDRRVQHRSKW
jgi:hypothetical protein